MRHICSRASFNVAAGNISVSFFQKSCYEPPSRLIGEGVRVVTNVAAGCDGRESRVGRTRVVTDGEVVWSWHPGADVEIALL
jgi:hypothetical protein